MKIYEVNKFQPVRHSMQTSFLFLHIEYLKQLDRAKAAIE